MKIWQVFSHIAVMSPCYGRSKSMGGRPLVPREFGDEQAHSAKIRDAGENQTRTDKRRQTVEFAMHKPAKRHTNEYQRSGNDAH
jgi:hypothetical protein